MSQRELLSSLLFNIILKVLVSTIRQVKVKIKVTHVRKKDVKLSLFTEYVIYIENLISRKSF